MGVLQIRDLNDVFRSTFIGGKVMMTEGVSNLAPEALAALMSDVRTFHAFTQDNDPQGEHDFGSIDIAHEKYFWKIDYYDKSLEFGSPDPSDPVVTTRVFTIMRADEY